MIKGQVITNKSFANSVYPKYLFENGNYDDSVVIANSSALAGVTLTGGSFIVETLQPVDSSVDVIKGIDPEGESFVFAPQQSTTTTGLTTVAPTTTLYLVE